MIYGLNSSKFRSFEIYKIAIFLKRKASIINTYKFLLIRFVNLDKMFHEKLSSLKTKKDSQNARSAFNKSF